MLSVNIWYVIEIDTSLDGESILTEARMSVHPNDLAPSVNANGNSSAPLAAGWGVVTQKTDCDVQERTELPPAGGNSVRFCTA